MNEAKQITEIDEILSHISIDIQNNLNLFKDGTVESGYLGLAVFNFFLHETYRDIKFLEQGELMIEHAIISISEQSKNEFFIPKYRGDTLLNLISSFGKGLLFIDKNLRYDYDFSSYYNQINETLKEIVEPALKSKDFDLFSGALAAGHYFLNHHVHFKSTVGLQIVHDIVFNLTQCAIYHQDDQVYWKAPAYGDKVYLGISHGSAMIINFLTKLFQHNILTRDNHNELNLLRNAVNFVWAQKRSFDKGFFPNFYPDIDVPNTPTQLSMCYGDLGVLYSLYNASQVIHDEELKNEVESMLLKTAARSYDSNYTLDGGVIFGCSGVYFILDRLYRNTGKKYYFDYSKYWIEQILLCKDPHQNTLSKFKFALEKYEDFNTAAKFSFGWGLAGIGCTLLSSFNKKLPALDELLIIGI
ncbi:lanthionine synthetase LanC family protein [Chryseobacterium sp. R2ACT005]|uniref:lanthionine synthetase LanC family protein n=1 Tax=Chryseobacterium sp. R2ACT005 TaxID=3416668 RepID=UPI003CF24CB7